MREGGTREGGTRGGGRDEGGRGGGRRGEKAGRKRREEEQRGTCTCR